MQEQDMKRSTASATILSRLGVPASVFLLALLPGWSDRPLADGHTKATNGFSVPTDVPLKHYRAYRRMHASTEKFKQEAWLEAWTEMDDAGFRYEIVSERGSDYIREKVLRNLLQREQQLIARGQAAAAELTPDNYRFEEPDAQGDVQRYILIKPKRKDVLLVNGRMMLSPDGTEVLRVEGVLSKNPSFWISSVNVTRDFARVDGVRVPIATESIAKLRMAGTGRMTVSYEYHAINGRPVSASAHRVLAAALDRQP
jgi:hypothetical protein